MADVTADSAPGHATAMRTVVAASAAGTAFAFDPKSPVIDAPFTPNIGPDAPLKPKPRKRHGISEEQK